MPGQLESGQSRFQSMVQGIDIKLALRGRTGEGDYCADILAPMWVGNADYCDLKYLRRNPQDLILDLPGRNILSAAHHQVLLTVDDEQQSCLIHRTDVSRVKPRVPKGAPSGLGIVPIANHHLRSLDDDFTGFFRPQHASIVGHDRNLDVRSRPSRRAQDALVAVKGVSVGLSVQKDGIASKLGHAIPL